jgi:hypothetical protein
VGDVKASRFAAKDTKLRLGQSTTLSWSVEIPSRCRRVRIYVALRQGKAKDSRRIVPIANTGYSLVAKAGRADRTLRRTSVEVELPNPVTIDTNHMQRTLRQALQTDKMVIRVKKSVVLNLSGWQDVPIAAGVKLLGERTATDSGPRLRVFTRPPRLFRVQGDNVRISGVRIEGPDFGVAGGSESCCTGIQANSRKGLEIDNNELSGWKGSAVEILDDDNQIDFLAPHDEVRVHDNYIHHNQHIGRLGYGVAVSNGAYVLIERNVFDANRHAIAGDGSHWSGYRAYDNLVLPNGGYHRHIPFCCWVYTHQFDMHGQNSCGVSDIFSDSAFNCGIAGHDMDIRHNSFLYTEKAAIKLRGTPQLSTNAVTVFSNTFRHDNQGDAIQQTESGLVVGDDNEYGVNSLDSVLKCDYDGNGSVDSFLATGRTWWYSSGGNRHLAFIKRSTERPATCPPRT